jgi:ABC-type sulfate transport system permease component
MMNRINFRTKSLLFLTVLTIFGWPGILSAYIDPGTTSVAFSALGYVFSMALLGIAFFIRPLRSLMKAMFGKLTGKGKLVENEEDQHGEELS